MTSIVQVSGWLQGAAAALPDTVVTRAAGPGWIGVVTSIAIWIIALLLIVILVTLLPAIRDFRRATGKTNALLDRMSAEFGPLVRHTAAIADNADYITTAVRSDVQHVSRTVHHATDRVNDALAASERRLRELGALLQLAQDEMEHAIVSTAATLRGVGAGAAAFRDEAHELLSPDDELDDLDDQLDDLEEREESDDGYDDTEPGDHGARPRIRRRGGHPA
jgi:uncharacterized protein YoxC